MIRMTSMPVALIENAYMILPEQEEMVFTPVFQDKLAGSISSGVLEFFGAAPAPVDLRARGRDEKKQPHVLSEQAGAAAGPRPGAGVK